MSLGLQDCGNMNRYTNHSNSSVDNSMVSHCQSYSIYSCFHPIHLFMAIIFCSLMSISSLGLTQALESPKPSDVRMVIDISGSMKKNDPKNLRRPALDMLVKLLPQGSKAGVWSFGQYVNMLVPHQMVDDEWANKASQASSKINSIAQYTNIGEALEKAAYDFQQSDDTYQKHIILLTDGMVDINRDSSFNEQERLRIINSVLPIYENANFTLHTIALSDNADQQLLTKLALATDGKAAVAKTAEELMNVFLQVFDQAVPAEEVPFDGDSFVVDSSIEEFTALIFRKPNAKDTVITSPDGNTFTKGVSDQYVSWFHTDKYDLITIKQPLEGEWKVSADLEPQSRITVVSDLSLVVNNLPTNISVNEVVPTSLALREDNQNVIRVEFLGLLDIDVEVTSSNGHSWKHRLSDDLVPRDGVYMLDIDQFQEEGSYTINFMVDGKSFTRQFSHALSVRKPFLVDVKQTDKQGAKEFTVNVIPQSKTIDISRTTVVGDVQKPSGRSQFLPFIPTDDGNWQLQFTPEEAGDYLLSVNVKITDNNNETSETSLKTIRLSQSSTEASVEEIEPEPIKKPEAINEPVVAEEPKVEEVPVSEEEPQTDMMQWVLYGVIAIVNILIVVVIYIIYRKFLKKKPEVEEGASDESLSEEDDLTEPPMDEMAVEDLEEHESEGAAEEKEQQEPQDSEGDKSEQADPEDMLESDPVAPEALDEELGNLPSDGDSEPEDMDITNLDDEADQEPEQADDDNDAEQISGIDLDDEAEGDNVPEFSLDDFSPESIDDEELEDDETKK